MATTPHAMFFSVTRKALAAAAVTSDQIVPDKRMTVNTMCLSRLVGEWAITTQHVELRRDDFKMGRVHAGVDSAQVVELHPCRYWPNHSDVACAMRQGVSLTLAADLLCKQSVAVLVEASGPNPTSHCVASALLNKTVKNRVRHALNLTHLGVFYAPN